MTVTVYEFDRVTEAGEPKHTASGARVLATAGTMQLSASTVYVVLAASVASYAGVGNATGTATIADFNLEAGKSYGLAIEAGRPTHVYVADAA